MLRQICSAINYYSIKKKIFVFYLLNLGIFYIFIKSLRLMEINIVQNGHHHWVFFICIHCLIKMMIIIYKTMFIKTKGNGWWSSSWCQLVNRPYKVHFIKQKFQNKIFLNVKAHVLFWFRKTLLSLNTLYIIILFWNFSIFTLITRSWRETIPIYRNYIKYRDYMCVVFISIGGKPVLFIKSKDTTVIWIIHCMPAISTDPAM